MDIFLDSYGHQKLKQEDLNHMNRSITQSETEAAIKSLPKKKRPGPDGFSAELYQTFKELIPTLLKLFHEIEREGKMHDTFPSFFIVILFICAYKAWVISHPFPEHPLRPLPLPPTPSIPGRNNFALISNFVEERV
jgi:hypothetical protein